MTDKEFKRLSRAQMIDIIYELQLELDKVNEEKQELESKLADKRLRLQSAGNIAEAALEINDCFKTAQNAAEQYLNEIKLIHAEAEEQRKQIIAQARAEASKIISNVSNAQKAYDSAMENIKKEIEQSQSDNG